ncbi:MAG TPA: DUF3710 domain-containing protein [Actinomycetes bacterium]|nr:DUF3710 domain-containing protein [Actinomycetes bacterium]
MFRRRRHPADEPTEAEPTEAELAEAELAGHQQSEDELAAAREADRAGELDRAGSSPGDQGTGPWDVDDLEHPRDGRIDLGALLVPAVQGMELQVEVIDQRIVSATALLAGSQLKLQAFAAPRTEGIWEEVRAELKGGISRQGGTVDEVDGPFGRELRARVPTRSKDGRSGVQATRFFGFDGPRWLLHATLTGRAATDPGSAGPIEALLRDIVVVRGGTPMPPRELIPMRLPEHSDAADEPDQDGRPPLDPYHRGPEITEIH